jgi:fibronectin type III domain protein/lipoprotein-associated protein
MRCDVVSRFARRVVCAAIFFFTLSIHASSSVTLAWNASVGPNVTSYSLRHGTVPGSYPTVINAGNALTATVTNLTAGTTYYFVVTARNSSGIDSDPSNEATYTAPGTPAPNLPPTLNAPGNVTVSEDATQQTVNLSGIGSGAANESQTLTVTASSSNPGLIPTPSITYTSPNTTGTLLFTPVADASGTATITVTVNDGQALNNTVSRTFTVTVNPVNDPPTLNSINNLTLNPSAGLQTISLSGIGSGGINESQTLAVTASSSNPGLIPAPAVTYSSPNATGTLKFTPVANATGTATITVTVSDGQTQNNLVTRTFTVTVTATSGPIYVEAESGTVVAPMVVATDANALNGRYVYSQTFNQGTVSYQVNIAQAGTYQVWCRVLSANNWTDSFYVSVDGGTEEFYSTAPNTWSPNWQWTRVNGEISGSPRTFALTQGTHTFVFRGRESSTFLDALYITSDANFVPPTGASNLPPTLNAPGNVTVSEDATQQTVNLSGIGSGAANESQTLTVTASSSNPGLIPTPSITYTSPNTTGTLLFTPVADASGTATITVTVNDGQALNNTVSRTFTVTVNPVNDPPTLNSINNLTLNPSAGLQTISLSGIGSGGINESQTLAVTASSSNPGLIPAPAVTYSSPNATGTLKFTPVANATGTATITVTVSDGQTQNNLVTRTFTVTVTATSGPIYVEAESGTVVAPMVVATDANALNGRYVYSQTFNQGTVSYQVNIAQAGTYQVWCRVLSANNWTDSFYVSVDGGTEDTYQTAQNTWSSAWQWTKVNSSGNPRTYTLSQGTHTFVFRGRESSTFLDALYITKDLNFVPPASGTSGLAQLSDTGGSSSELVILRSASSSSEPGSGDILTISWDRPGTLQSTTEWVGTNTIWSIEGTTSPVTVNPTGAARFYRLLVQE